MRKQTPKRGCLQKNFAANIEEVKEHHCENGKPLKVLAFDEARFGLINWHRRRYCPMGFRPPYVVKRAYKWTYLYAAVEPTSGESFCMYLPGMDDGCLEVFLDELSKRYPDHHLLVVLDGAPSHRSEQIVHPQNISFLRLPPCSPELEQAERAYSHRKAGQPGPLTRLLSSDRPPTRFEGRTFHTKAYCPHPATGDYYPHITGLWLSGPG